MTKLKSKKIAELNSLKSKLNLIVLGNSDLFLSFCTLSVLFTSFVEDQKHHLVTLFVTQHTYRWEQINKKVIEDHRAAS